MGPSWQGNFPAFIVVDGGANKTVPPEHIGRVLDPSIKQSNQCLLCGSCAAALHLTAKVRIGPVPTTAVPLIGRTCCVRSNDSTEPFLRLDLTPASRSTKGMITPEKACPIVVRLNSGQPEVLAFAHPSAGKQFVKGTIESAENPNEAAIRELLEESGICCDKPLLSLGAHLIGKTRQRWHFFQYVSSGLPETWYHQTGDDFGHTFAFFWHPLTKPLDQGWHSIFHEAFAFFAPRCKFG